MKQHFTLFIATLILSVCFPLTALSYDVVVDGIYYNLVTKVKTAEVTIGDNLYTGEITIPETITVDEEAYSVTSIGERAFDNCRSLTSVTIPNSVTSIGKEAFDGCSSLTSVTIPTSVTSIGYRTFYGCSSLTSVTIPNSVISIGDLAFWGCSGLTSVTIPNSVTRIGSGAFFGCSSLTSITIPGYVTEIVGNAFSMCPSLTSISVDPNNAIYDSRDNCNAIIRTSDNALIVGCQSTIIPNSVTSIGICAFEGCSSLTSVTIPNSVISIGDFAFSMCSSLTSVTIPNSVTYIGNLVFRDCSILTSISVDSDNTTYDSRDNCNAIIRASDNTLIVGCQSTTIPNSVTSIGINAFAYCTSLTSITIPNSVTSIGGYAFYDCSSLTSVTIPNSVTSIGELAFLDCTSLTSLTIGDSVTRIEWGAFGNCENLENVYCYAEKVPWAPTDVFGYSNVESATLYVPASAIDSYKTTSPWSKFGTIKTLDEVEKEKCETPTIAFSDGRLTFSCATDDVEYVSEVKCADVNTYYTAEVALTACYDISVTATKTGYENSDVATAKLYWLTSSETSDDDTNINSVSKRGIAIQTAAGFITISGLNDNEKVDFYTLNGTALGAARATNGVATFSAQSGSVLIARIGNESVKIIVE